LQSPIKDDLFAIRLTMDLHLAYFRAVSCKDLN